MGPLLSCLLQFGGEPWAPFFPAYGTKMNSVAVLLQLKGRNIRHWHILQNVHAWACLSVPAGTYVSVRARGLCEHLCEDAPVHAYMWGREEISFPYSPPVLIRRVDAMPNELNPVCHEPDKETNIVMQFYSCRCMCCRQVFLKV